MDDAHARRKAELATRFEEQSKARSEERERRIAAENEERDPAESTQRFLSETFGPEVAAVRAEVERTVQLVANPGGADPNQVVNSHLDGLVHRVGELQEHTAAAALFLPPYDLRTSQETLRELGAAIAEARETHAPRKKFSFAARRRQRQQEAAAAPATEPEAATEPEPEPAAPAPAQERKPVRFKAREHTIADVTGGEVVVRADELPAGMDVVLSNVSDCVVTLLGHMGALRMSDVNRCQVYAGPIAGSAHVERLDGCTLVLATRQLRVHYATGCDFYLHANSHPIIEDCSGLRFAPYPLWYPQLPALMQAAGLAGMPNRWSEVNDFKWHRQQHSPNWAVLPEEERATTATSEHVSMAGPPAAAASDSEDEL